MGSPAALSIGSCAGLAPVQTETYRLWSACPIISTSSTKLYNNKRESICSSWNINNAASSHYHYSNTNDNKGIKPLTLKAVAVDSNQSGSTEPSPQLEKPNKYYFVVANAKFMLDEEEHFQELLKERLRNYDERNKEQDFWLVIEPKFLDKFPNITKRLKRPAVALVSTNGPWITFMKLRLDRVLAESYEADSLEEVLAGNPADLKFEKPENWIAPYPKYEYGWWEPFLPPASVTQKA